MMRHLMLGVAALFALFASPILAAATQAPQLPPPLKVPAKPAFVVSSVSALKLALGALKPAPLASSPVRIVPLVPPLPTSQTTAFSYDLGQGVVLNACHLKHAASASAMQVLNVNLNDALQSQMAASDPNAAVDAMLSWGSVWSSILATGTFQHLPAGQHTYCLAIGTSAPADYAYVGLAAYNVAQSFESSELSVNPLASEIRVYFQLDVPETGTIEKAALSFIIGLKPMPAARAPGGVAEVWLDHVQLARVD
jgi:hypothetical protein